MNTKSKRIISILLVVSIVATLCVALVGCGDNSKSFELTTNSDKIKDTQTLTLGKDTTYYINLTDNTDAYHTITLSANSNVDVTLQTRYPYKKGSWQNVNTIGVTKKEKSVNVKVSSYTDYALYSTTNVRMNQEYRLVVKPNANVKLRVCWERFVQEMDTDFANGKSYAWTPTTTPQQNAFQVKSIFYLSKSEARVMGALLRDQSFIDSIKKLDGQKNIAKSVFDKMTGIIKKAVDTYLNKNKDITKFNSANFAKMVCECFGELISYAIGIWNLNTQMEKASEILLNATTPMKLTFSQGNSEQPSKNLYSLTATKLSARKVTINGKSVTLYNCKVPDCYMGKFTPYATR